jgi:cytochrome b561
VGATYESARGDSLFNLFRMPSFARGNIALIHSICGYYTLAANGVLIIAGLHVLAALSHHPVMGDEVVVRMAPVFSRFRAGSML